MYNMYNMYNMYSAQRDEDTNSLSSSFWSDGGRQEGEEEEEEEKAEIERVVGEGDLKPVGNAEDSHREASGEVEVEIGEEGSKAVGVSEDSRHQDSKPVAEVEASLQEASEEEGEDSKPLSNSEDSYQEDSEEEDSNPLSHSEDSHQEDSEEIDLISEEESRSVGDAEDYLQEASEEEDDSKPPGHSEDSHQEVSAEIEQEISEEESKSVGDVEDSLQESSEEEEEDDDSNPLSDSEDSHQEDSEIEEESRSVTDTEDDLQEVSEKEDEEEDSKPPGNSDESHQENSEEEAVEIERVISVEGSKPVGDADDHLQEASKEEEEDSNPLGDAEDRYQEPSEEEKPELKNQVYISGGGLEGGNDDDDGEECCSSSSDSPAPSLMTSGYGTYKPEELEGGDDHTITEFDQDSRGDLSEMRDDDEEDDRSLCSFGWFDLKPADPDHIETRPMSVLEDGEPEASVALCGDDDEDLHNEVDVTEEDEDQAREEKVEVDLHVASEERQFCNGVVKEKVDVSDDDGMLEDAAQDRREETEVADKVESEGPDESSSNKDIKFIDSKVDFSQMTFEKMCEDWEGNLRQKTASSLEERLAELHLSPSARCDVETESDDVTSQTDSRSSETDGVSLSAFESYIRGMTRTRSDGDLRPKPKSFIRPAMSQQTIKKTDPVAKYFKYKQLWEMFKLPGEKDRRSLRWEIKEQLAYRPPPPKPRRVYVPNSYVVPTEKKRSALRWEIRTDLANGLLPHRFSHQC